VKVDITFSVTCDTKITCPEDAWGGRGAAEQLLYMPLLKTPGVSCPGCGGPFLNLQTLTFLIYKTGLKNFSP
jgi:hypothetical protein